MTPLERAPLLYSVTILFQSASTIFFIAARGESSREAAAALSYAELNSEYRNTVAVEMEERNSVVIVRSGYFPPLHHDRRPTDDESRVCPSNNDRPMIRATSTFVEDMNQDDFGKFWLKF